MKKSLYRSEVDSNIDTLLTKIAALATAKASRVVFAYQGKLFRGHELNSFTIDPDEDVDTIVFNAYDLPKKATKVIQDLTYFAEATGPGGNDVTIAYTAHTPAVAASRTIQSLVFTAKAAGTAGNAITIAYTTGATAGSEVVGVVSSAISVQIQTGVSTATQVKAAIDGDVGAAALVSVAIVSGQGATGQTAPVSATNLQNGAAAVGLAGSEVVTVVGNAISVKLQSGTSTATQVKAAIDGKAEAAALVDVTISGTGSNTQTAPVVAANLASGGTFGNSNPRYFDKADIQSITRLRTKKYKITIKDDADSAAD